MTWVYRQGFLTRQLRCWRLLILQFVAAALCLMQQPAIADLLQPFNYNSGSISGVQSVANTRALLVKFTLPQSGVSYDLDSVLAFSKRSTLQGVFADGTTIKIQVLDKDAHSLFLSDNFDLSGEDDGLATREFLLHGVHVSDSFYAGIQPTGLQQFIFGVGFDVPLGRNYGVSYVYNPANGSLALQDQDAMIAANVSQSVTGLAGDYNDNGVVDAADYVWWRKNSGIATGYDTWRTNFGHRAGSGSLAGGSIPEPTSLMLAAFMFIGGGC